MKLGITEKDKKLLIMLLMFVIVVGIGYWGIYPNIKSMKKIEKSIEKEKEKKEENEEKTAQLPVLRKDNKAYEEDILVVREDFFPVMTSDMVDKYLTNMVLGYKLNAYNLEISMPKSEVILEPYFISKKAVDAEKKDKKEKKKEKEEKKEKENIKTGVYCVQVSFKVGGDEKTLIKFIDDLADSDKKLRINKYSWQNERNVSYDEDGSYDIDVRKVLNITLDLYMCNE